jgi:hypothetical protein
MLAESIGEFGFISGFASAFLMQWPFRAYANANVRNFYGSMRNANRPF